MDARRKYKNPIISVASFFLLTDLFERFAYYTSTGSLTIYFKRELGLDSVLATQMQSTFQSIVYVVPLIGAYAADSLLGRYKVCHGCALVPHFLLGTLQKRPAHSPVVCREAVLSCPSFVVAQFVCGAMAMVTS